MEHELKFIPIFEDVISGKKNLKSEKVIGNIALETS